MPDVIDAEWMKRTSFRCSKRFFVSFSAFERDTVFDQKFEVQFFALRITFGMIQLGIFHRLFLIVSDDHRHRWDWCCVHIYNILLKKYTSGKSKMKAASLFSGCGGDCVGMTEAGLHVSEYVELSPLFCETHDANFENCEKIGNDIQKISDETFREYKGKWKVLFAGFPCQSFSQGGKKDANDPRGQLFKDFVRVAKEAEPEYIIGENVKGLLTRTTNDGELFIDVIVKEFEKIGYTCKYQVMKCEEYGVPQKRERLIIIGTRNNAPLSFPEPSSERIGLQNIVKFDLTNAIEVPKAYFDGIPSECILEQRDKRKKVEVTGKPHPYLKRMLEMGSITWEVKQKTKEFPHGFSFGKRESPLHVEIVDIRNPSKTIICTYARQPRLFVPLKHKDKYYLRCFLPDELKQIQGFPENYILKGKPSDQIVQIGNAVPPPLIERVVANIIEM